MSTHLVDLATWPRTAQFRFFRSYDRPHYAVTSRLDVTTVMARRADGVSPYRACLHAIGAGIHAVPELCMRFRGDQVVRHDIISLSMTVPTQAGSFGYADVPFVADFASFDRQAQALIAQTAAGADLAPNDGERDDLAYLSCMPWLDYTAINNALPGPQDCIPRVTWGRIVDHGGRHDMAMTLEVHHALVDSAQGARIWRRCRGRWARSETPLCAQNALRQSIKLAMRRRVEAPITGANVRLERGRYAPALLFYIRSGARPNRNPKTGGDNRSARIKPNVRKTTPHGKYNGRV